MCIIAYNANNCNTNITLYIEETHYLFLLATLSLIVYNDIKVKKVSSSHVKALCEIISENEIDESKLKKAISDTGYSVTSFKAEPYEKKKGLFSFLSK